MDQQIEVKANDHTLHGKYTNNMQVTQTKEEFVIDFFNIFPPTGQLVSRVISSPSQFKRMLEAMAESLKKYEEQFGPISKSETPDERKIGFKTD